MRGRNKEKRRKGKRKRRYRKGRRRERKEKKRSEGRREGRFLASPALAGEFFTTEPPEKPQSGPKLGFSPSGSP